ncbi:hypothetical protein H257_00213 [Aphanomyces astaci]|uniref:Uncharacterized protein n=1 Tax=Aphanomyces astaci TaxID=112090 RepID=W4HAV1_APHAT|nr:hypothetical protein H257_00213 [Aphanomyces astaci]ETV88691.1 hypothetical protein H257_00213 [Aphanomyces astaci]|eukprot:XP_009821091.1 hypothetical protein H257_00213 [Aphanomyces astaci]
MSAAPFRVSLRVACRASASAADQRILCAADPVASSIDAAVPEADVQCDLFTRDGETAGMDIASTYRQPRFGPSPGSRNRRDLHQDHTYAKATSSKKVPPINIDLWRREWYTAHQRSDSPQPIELILKALQATPQERRALIPSSLCATEGSQEFWIPSPGLTQAFPLAVIMDSLLPSEELEAVEVKAKTKLDPSTSTRNWEVPLSNRYEIFTLEPDSNIPDFDLKVFLSPTTLGISPTVSKLLLKKLDELGDTLSPGAALDRLCSQETPDFSAQDHIQLVLWDLFAMISAPSIYFDPVKMAHASQTSLLVSRECSKLLLWSGSPLFNPPQAT